MMKWRSQEGLIRIKERRNNIYIIYNKLYININI